MRCAQCGKDFEPIGHRVNPKYCSTTCAAVGWSKAERNAALYSDWLSGNYTRAQLGERYGLGISAVDAIKARERQRLDSLTAAVQEPIRQRRVKRPTPDPEYRRELKRRLPGGDRWEHMLQLGYHYVPSKTATWKRVP